PKDPSTRPPPCPPPENPPPWPPPPRCAQADGVSNRVNARTAALWFMAHPPASGFYYTPITDAKHAQRIIFFDCCTLYRGPSGEAPMCDVVSPAAPRLLSTRQSRLEMTCRGQVICVRRSEGAR